MLDVYYTTEYGILCESMDDGKFETFECRTGNGVIQNKFMLREIPQKVDGKQYYDIVTPYGYGGPIVLEASDKETLVREYAVSFDAYCKEHGVVSEFIRFHPIFKNYEDFASIYETIYSRHTVGTNLADYEDPVQGDFGKSARKEVRHAEANGVICSIHEKPDSLAVFRALYEETMDRNHADKMYYFPDSYYDYLTHEMRESILEIRAEYEGRVIGSELYFIVGDLMHAHLLGSGQELIELKAGALIEATAARWGKEHGYRYIHHGGGRTSAPDDPLYLYKSKFGKHTEFDFYVGKKIWDTAVYDRLVAERRKNGPINDENFFPVYRAE